MERVIQLHIEKLPEGVYLATSDEVQRLVARGRTIQETIEIAREALLQRVIRPLSREAHSKPLSMMSLA
jgi:predicted RNase H-like HicB family nuclease